MKNRTATFALLTLILLLNFSCTKDSTSLSCLSQQLQQGVIAFYPFSGGSLLDESNFDHDLININTTPTSTDREGNQNCAYVFDNLGNLDQHLKTEDTDFLNNLPSFSISLWYAPIRTARSGLGYEVLVGRGEFIVRCPDRRGEWSLGLYDLKVPVFGHNNAVRGFSILGSYPEQVSGITDVWHHVVAVKDGDSYSIYMDGLLRKSKDGNAGCFNLHLALDEGDLYIGKAFSGKIDDIIIYNRGLFDNEVKELYEMGVCCD